MRQVGTMIHATMRQPGVEVKKTLSLVPVASDSPNVFWSHPHAHHSLAILLDSRLSLLVLRQWGEYLHPAHDEEESYGLWCWKSWVAVLPLSLL